MSSLLSSECPAIRPRHGRFSIAARAGSRNSERRPGGWRWHTTSCPVLRTKSSTDASNADACGCPSGGVSLQPDLRHGDHRCPIVRPRRATRSGRVPTPGSPGKPETCWLASVWPQRLPLRPWPVVERPGRTDALFEFSVRTFAPSPLPGEIALGLRRKSRRIAAAECDRPSPEVGRRRRAWLEIRVPGSRKEHLANCRCPVNCLPQRLGRERGELC